MKKALLIILLICITIILFIFVYRIKMGYYPIPEIIRRMYYQNSEETNLNTFHLSDNFKVNQKKYFIDCSITNMSLLSQNLNLYFNNFSNMPPDFLINGKYQIEVFNNNKRIYNIIANQMESINKYGKDGRAKFTYGIIFETLPMFISGYKNVDLKITVLEPFTNLFYIQYITNNQLYLIPDISLH